MLDPAKSSSAASGCVPPQAFSLYPAPMSAVRMLLPGGNAAR